MAEDRNLNYINNLHNSINHITVSYSMDVMYNGYVN